MSKHLFIGGIHDGHMIDLTESPSHLAVRFLAEVSSDLTSEEIAHNYVEVIKQEYHIYNVVYFNDKGVKILDEWIYYLWPEAVADVMQTMGIPPEMRDASQWQGEIT